MKIFEKIKRWQHNRKALKSLEEFKESVRKLETIIAPHDVKPGQYIRLKPPDPITTMSTPKPLECRALLKDGTSHIFVANDKEEAMSYLDHRYGREGWKKFYSHTGEGWINDWVEPPKPSNEIEERIIEEIRRRRDKGRNKYGTSMERTDLTRKQWLQHAKEESLDNAIYLEKLIVMEEKSERNSTIHVDGIDYRKSTKYLTAATVPDGNSTLFIWHGPHQAWYVKADSTLE